MHRRPFEGRHLVISLIYYRKTIIITQIYYSWSLPLLVFVAAWIHLPGRGEWLLRALRGLREESEEALPQAHHHGEFFPNASFCYRAHSKVGTG